METSIFCTARTPEEQPAWTDTVYQVVQFHDSGERKAIVAIKFWGDPQNEVCYPNIESGYLFLSRTFVMFGGLRPGTSAESIGAFSFDWMIHSGEESNRKIILDVWALTFQNHSLTRPYPKLDDFLANTLHNPPSLESSRISDETYLSLSIVPTQTDLNFQHYDVGFGREFRIYNGVMIAGQGSRRMFGAVRIACDMYMKFLEALHRIYPQVDPRYINRHGVIRFSFFDTHGYVYSKFDNYHVVEFRFPLGVSIWLVLAKAIVGLFDSKNPSISTPSPKSDPMLQDIKPFFGDCTKAIVIAKDCTP